MTPRALCPTENNHNGSRVLNGPEATRLRRNAHLQLQRHVAVVEPVRERGAHAGATAEGGQLHVHQEAVRQHADARQQVDAAARLRLRWHGTMFKQYRLGLAACSSGPAAVYSRSIQQLLVCPNAQTKPKHLNTCDKV